MTTKLLEKGQLKKELFTYLIITFAATYILQFIIYAIAGPISDAMIHPLWNVGLNISMFIPAIAAIVCMAYFKSNALTNETKIIFTFFFVYAILYVSENFFHPIMGTIMGKPLVSSIIAIIGIITVIIMHLKKKWRKNLELSKLSFGKNPKYYIIIPVIFAVILIISAILFYVLGLGVPEKEFNLYLFFESWMPLLLMTFLISWPAFFGEEYGWRVYLQDRLFPLLGGYKGVIILGIIWGLWHVPGIVFGHNFPGYPILGNVLFTLFCIVFGIILSYAVLKTGSVWIAVILHLINNKFGQDAGAYIAGSNNIILTEGIQIALLAAFAIILLLVSKVWKMNKKSCSN